MVQQIAEVIALQEQDAQSRSTTSGCKSQKVSLRDKQPVIAGNNPLSVFRDQPPATLEQIMPLMYRLGANFPAMNTTYTVGNEFISFWTVLGEQLAVLGWSIERIEYATAYILRNCKYSQFRVAEFLNIDQQVHTITNEEFAKIERSKEPHEPIVVAQLDGRYRMLYKEDADRSGITDYRRCYTTWEASQMTQEERKSAGIQWM